MNGIALALGVAVAGGVGAAARHLCDRAATLRWGEGQVRGILAVNVVGSFLIGLLTGSQASVQWQSVLGIGLLGGFTTFSTAMLQAVGPDRVVGARTVIHLCGTALLSVLAAGLGLWLSVR